MEHAGYAGDIRDTGLGSPTRRALSPRQLTLQIACESVINYSKTGHFKPRPKRAKRTVNPFRAGKGLH